jgi:hypothetical protein
MMPQNTLHSTGYQPVRQYICLQAQCNVPKTSIGQAENIKYFKIFLLYTYPSLKMALVHNTSHVFTYIQLPRTFPNFKPDQYTCQLKVMHLISHRTFNCCILLFMKWCVLEFRRVLFRSGTCTYHKSCVYIYSIQLPTPLAVFTYIQLPTPLAVDRKSVV